MTKRSNTRIIIRTARASDCKAMLKLWNQAGIRSSSTDEIRAMQIRLRRDRDLFLVACQGSRLVGTLIAGWDGWRGSMARLAVDPLCRRQRVAQRLVQAGEARLWKKGAKRIGALVFSDNTAAEHFWLAAGYVPEANIRRFVKNLSS